MNALRDYGERPDLGARAMAALDEHAKSRETPTANHGETSPRPIRSAGLIASSEERVADLFSWARRTRTVAQRLRQEAEELRASAGQRPAPPEEAATEGTMP